MAAGVKLLTLAPSAVTCATVRPSTCAASRLPSADALRLATLAPRDVTCEVESAST